MQKVIFVGGTAYSGSTFFDMTLGNDPAGFSIGEVYALFNPYRPHHVRPDCGCGNPNCDIWAQIQNAGKQDLYQTIFDIKPEVEFIVDSSKDPFWISQQTRSLHNAGIETRNIVIWKSPLELASSYKKRGKLTKWERAYVDYFRLYVTKIEGWRSISYADYTRDPEVLKQICGYLDIPYFKGKEEFWHKEHHLLFGNKSARLHIENAADQEEATLDYYTRATQVLRTIYYREVEDPELEQQVAHRLKDSPDLQKIDSLLEARDIRKDTVTDQGIQDLTLSPATVNYRSLKQAIRYGVGHLLYGRDVARLG